MLPWVASVPPAADVAAPPGPSRGPISELAAWQIDIVALSCPL